jgi:succinate-semialdehyde dehydrogenase/glutarate-semialdehyde dehydrogenase
MHSATTTFKSIKNKSLLQTKGYINGSWTSALSGASFDVINPANLEVLSSIPEMGKEDTTKAIEAAHAAFKTFKKTTGRERARMLRKWSDLCHENIEDLAIILTMENGKPLAEAKGEVAYGASFLEWFAGEAER